MNNVALLAVCPNCPVGRQARDAFWSEQPEYYLTILALPFALVALGSRLLSSMTWRSKDE